MIAKRLYTIAVLFLVIGCILFLLISIYRYDLSDFALGFCEGASAMSILSSAIYLIIYFIKKKSL